MPIVGTAGHVDHGKSTLVRALTGRDPDRWDEEKRRGLTIDLGFAWATLPDGTAVGFVDVPGHERFIRNMLAGVDAVDVALFVVAADEGWMPQSEEHLAVLDLLGIRRGVVALTRVDLAGDDLADLVELDVRDRLADTTLAEAPLVRVAAPAGRGIDDLRSALAEALRGVAVPDRGRTRMWIDRSFTIGGAGTVVTGTLLDGSVAVGDTLAVWPEGREVRVRSIQSHEEPRERVHPGNRVALNLAGLERTEVTRGAMLGRRADWIPTTRFTADLRTIRSLEEPLRDRGAYHLHVGSGGTPARIRLLESPALRGSGAALIHPAHPLALKVGDRVILREVGRRAVVAGGAVLDPHPAQRRAEVRGTLPRLRSMGSDPDDRAAALLETRGRADLHTLAADSGGGRPPQMLAAGGEAMSPAAVAELTDRALAIVDRFHAEHPLRPGIPKSSLAESLDVRLPMLDALIEQTDRLVDDGPAVRLASFDAEPDDEAAAAWQAVRARLREAGWAVPRRSELGLDPELLHSLIRSERLIAVGDFAYAPDDLQELVRVVEGLSDGFTVADFRDELGITRKHAVPLLEWLDSRGITRREGDGRVVRRRPPAAPAPGGAPSR